MSENTNQTLFAAQEPYLDSPRSFSDPVDPNAPVPVYKQRKFQYLLGAIGVLVAVLVVSGVMMSGNSSPMTLLEPSPTPKAQVSGKYAKELKLLKEDLQKADPTQKELPFPPINPEISL